METSGMEALCADVKRVLEPFCPPGTVVTVALSGGMDSVVLLSVLVRLRGEMGLGLTAAHLNHGIRENASEDAAFAERLCLSMGVKFRRSTADVPAIAARTGMSLEEAARDARYAFLERVREEEGAQWILTAHHERDQAETVLFRLLRGSSLEGLSGMRTSHGHILRPLLGEPWERLRRCALEQGLAWREDETNADTDIPRNGLRHEILPLLEKVHPRAVANTARTAKALARDDACLWELARPLAAGMRREGEVWRIPAEPLTKAHAALAIRALLEAARSAGLPCAWESVHIEAALGVLEGMPGRSADLPGGLRLTRERDDLLWEFPPQETTAHESVPFPGEPGVYVLCEGTLTVTDSGTEGQPIDLDRVPKGAVLRGRLPGDVMVPLGMKGHKKLKEILQADGIPARERSRLTVLAAGNRVLHILGTKRIDDSIRITPETVCMRVLMWEPAKEKEST